MAQAKQRAPQTITKSAWEKLGTHTVTLPSGAVVKIRIPDLTLLLAADAVPDQLRQVALEQISQAVAAEQARAAGAEPPPTALLDQEKLEGMATLHQWMIAQTLVEPAFTLEELEHAQIPSEDRVMLAQFAGRERVTDARGVRLGVEPLERWDLWREAHSCPEKCEHCSSVIDALSSVTS